MAASSSFCSRSSGERPSRLSTSLTASLPSQMSVSPPDLASPPSVPAGALHAESRSAATPIGRTRCRETRLILFLRTNMCALLDVQSGTVWPWCRESDSEPLPDEWLLDFVSTNLRNRGVLVNRQM